MATLGKWSGGTTSIIPTGSWAAPNALFPTQDRNDGTAYGWSSSTSTLTLPSSGLADGYLIVASVETHDTSNGRVMPNGKFIQASGTGNFVGGFTGGYSRDASEDRAYVRTWAFIDNPSASATFTFQWKSAGDSMTGGTERSEIQVIPLFYSNHGIYTSTSSSTYGGTTPTVVTGFSVVDESDTAAIQIASSVVTLKTDNKRYLVLNSQYFEMSGNARTQRWHGLDIDGTEEHAAKAYTYYRNAANEDSGDMFTWLIDRVTTNITIEQTCYRGIGVSNLQGGADGDGAVGTGNHTMVVLELNDSAEVFRSHDPNQSALLATTGAIDLDINETTAFNDTASFTDLAASSINVVQTSDCLFGANISAASNAVTNTARWTAYSEFTINGTENPDSVAGDYMRNDQGSAGCWGWSANLMGFEALTAGDDVGVSVTELAGSEGGGAGVSPAGWSGFWGINLDTLEGAVAVYELEGFQFRDDDGSEITATDLGAQDVNLATRAPLENTRLRMLIDSTTGDPATAQITLQYRRKGDAASEWRDV